MKIILVICCLLALTVPPIAKASEQELALATQLYYQAVTLNDQKKFQEALPLLKKSLALREHVLGPEHELVAESLNILGETQINLGQIDIAIQLFKRALTINEKIFGESNFDTGLYAFNLGVAYNKLNQFDNALPFFERALAISRRLFGNEHTYTATVLNMIATNYQSLAQYKQALILFKQVLTIREEINGFNSPDTAYAMNNIGSIYDELGQYKDARTYFERALVVLEKNSDSNLLYKTSIMNNLGSIYFDVGLYKESKSILRQALSLGEAAATSNQEQLSITSTLNNLGMVYESLAEYDQSLPYYLRAVSILENIAGADQIDTATAISNLATFYEHIGQYDLVMPLLHRALNTQEKFLGPNHPRVAITLNKLASYYDNENALLLLQRALEIQQIFFGKDSINTTTTLNHIGMVYNYMGNPNKALPYFQDALNLDKNSSAIKINIANTYEQLGKSVKAFNLYLKSYHAALKDESAERLMLTSAYLGRYFVKNGQANAAIFFYKQSVNIMQAIRDGSRSLDKNFQYSLLKKNEYVYTQLISLLIDEGRLAEAQQVLSMLKEDEFFDFIRRDIHTDSQETRINFNDKENPLDKRLQKLGAKAVSLADESKLINKKAKLGLSADEENQLKDNKSQMAVNEKRTIATLTEVAEYLNKFHKKSAKNHVINSATKLQRILSKLGNGSALLQYIVTDTRVHILVTTPHWQLAREATISEKELHRKIGAFRRVLQNPSVDPRPLAHELYQLLFAPIAVDLKSVPAKTLMFSLDGSLRYLPMSALYDGKTYLAERYALAVYTDVTKNKLLEKPNLNWKIAGLGTSQKNGEFPALPSVKFELNGIVKVSADNAGGGVLPGNIYLDQAFTQQQLHDVVEGNYPVIHIASHFKFIPGMEAQSFLLLGDGHQLTLSTLRTDAWKFNSVDLVTLSACETGLGGGKDANGREIEGFGALVQRQGAKGVLATLWPVADQSTAMFMQKMYRLRQENGLTKAEALREAQLALLSGQHARPTSLSITPASNGELQGSANAPAFTPDPAKPFAHPYYWAPFILMGNWL